MTPFKFFTGGSYSRTINRNYNRRINPIFNGVITVHDNVFNAREVAVIASSLADFHAWRISLFVLNDVGYLHNNYFTVYDRDIDLTTRYRAITTINECRGLTFDDYTTTERLDELLDRADDEVRENHIRELILEVTSKIRDNENI